MVDIVNIDDLEVLTEQGFKSISGIKRSMRSDIYYIKFGDGSFIKCTSEHRLKSGELFKYARDIQIGDIVSDTHVVSIEYIERAEHVYDLLNVEDTNHYITNNVTSHNCAFVENWDEFFASVYPTISSGETTKILLTSTPNGLNHFYKTCHGAQQKDEEWNGYQYVNVSWERVPGRDEKWKNDVLASMDWDYQKFAQEFCCEFLGSSGTLIDGATLKRLVPKRPLSVKNNIFVYEEPQKDRTYVGVVDVSRGKGLDYSVLQIIDVTKMPYNQVCVFRDNMTSPVEFTEIIHRVCSNYNDAVTLVEINDIGGQVSDMLYMEYEYENVLFTETAGRAGRRLSSGFGAGVEKGVRTTKQVKSVGCSIVKLLIEQTQLIINDHETISELSTFSKKGTSYEAEPGCHDDLVMCLVLFAWMSDQRYFKELTDINTLSKLRQKTEEELFEEVPFFGHIDDGLSNFYDEDDTSLQYTSSERKWDGFNSYLSPL